MIVMTIIAINDPGIFWKIGGDGNNKYTDNPYYERPRINCMDMFEVSNPFGDKIGRYFFHRQPEQVFHLCGKNGQCDTAGKADNDRVGDEFNDCAEFLMLPMITSMIPAITVAMASPSIPKFCMIPYTMTINAPVGPPICTLLPPRKETMNPPIIAVINPFPD